MTKILIIDDEETLRDSLREFLESKGYTVVDAPDGVLGTEMFRTEGADVVITDLIMPLMDGMDTIRTIRREERDVKILALSGRGGVHINMNLERARNFGADASLQKPCDPGDVLQAVESLLG
jgi:DNA-binding response OmpR family regulator